MSHGPIVHFFSGKGGAGKSTLAVAHAYNLLDASERDKILLLSMERPGGIEEVLQKSLSETPAQLQQGKGSGGLFAAALDKAVLQADFQKAFEPVLLRCATPGAVFTREELKKLLKTCTGHLDGVAFLFHLKQLVEAGQFARVVVDGPSSTDMQRLLHRAMQLRRLTGLLRCERAPRNNKKDTQPSHPIDEYALQADALVEMLRDGERFGLSVVTLAEPVADVQTRLFVKGLGEGGVSMTQIIVNMIEDGKGSREVANRRGLQAPHVRKYQTMHEQVHLVRRHVVGPRGVAEIKKFGKEWASGKETKALAFEPAEAPPALVRAPSMPLIAAPPIPATRFIFFVGNGGGGKSSCAAAAAVALTEKDGPVLIVSADPTQALAEVFQGRLTDTESQVRGTKGLYAREIDFSLWQNTLRKRLKELVEPIFGPEARGKTLELDKNIFRNLVDATPAGLDELAVLWSLMETLMQERFKRVVVDLPPSVNGVNVLELPGIVKPWLDAMHALAVKHKAKGTGQLLAWVAQFQKHLTRFEEALLNPNECRFIVVMRAETLSLRPTELLVKYLKAKRLPFERVLVNRVLPKTTCPLTEERRNNELDVAKAIEKRIGLPVTLAPALSRHPAGLRELKAFRTSWYALSASSNKNKAA